MINKNKIYKIYKLLRARKINQDFISPNYIADFGYNREIYLSSDEVVYINNHYNLKLEVLR
jgi:hypothetical protein